MEPEIISTGHDFDDGLDAPETESPVELADLRVAPAEHGLRIDRFLAFRLPAFSRSYFQQLLAQGDVHTAGHAVAKPSVKVRVGDVVQVRLCPTPQAHAFRPEPLALRLLHEDDDLMVVDKPAGLVVHPGAGHWSGTLLNGLLHHHAAAAQLPRAGIVHRLDKDTSGAMVVAKNRETMEALVRLIAAREVQRLYLGVVGRAWPHAESVTVREALGRDPKNRIRMAVLDGAASGARPAQTQFLKLQSSERSALVAAKLFTGRTHQIRVHLLHLGCPLFGDAVYGGPTHQAVQRQALHAGRLVFVHPKSQQRINCRSPLPADLVQLLHCEGLNYNPDRLSDSAFLTTR